jgi:O-antigen/teichoic acid export membrane protein
MNGATKAISYQGLRRRALSLGAVKAFDHAMQFLLPVVLVRCLDTATFGEYRLLWLAVGTVMTIATLNMVGSLYFFVPRSDARMKRLYIHHTLLYLALAGLVCGLAVSAWNPLLPSPIRPLGPYGALVPAFVGLWVLATLLDALPTIDERIGWQAFATGTTAVLRFLVVGAGAWLTADLRVILWLLIAVVLVKLVLLAFYVQRHHGLGRPWFGRAAFAGQLGQAAPFGFSNALFALRAQCDQWVAASLFALSSFAAFSIAAIVGQVVHIFRHSVMEAFMPSMSRMEAAGDVRGMMVLNSRANVMAGTALYPLLGFAFAFAEDIVTVFYTAAYVEAAPVMRVYIAGMAAMVIEIGSIVLLLRQGPYALRLTALALAVSVAASWSAAQHFGLPGAAAGSVLAVYLDRALMLRRVSRLTGIALRELQDWRGLGLAAAFAVITVAVAWALVESFFASSAPLARLAAGAAVMALAYALARREWK